MKLIDKKIIKKGKSIWPRGSKYLITLEVTDKDIERIEDLATTYYPFEEYHRILKENPESLLEDNELDCTHFTDEYQKFLSKLFSTFSRCWDLE